MSAPSRERPSPAEQEARRQAARAAGSAPVVVGEVPPAEARAVAAASVIAGLVAFLAAVRARDQKWLTTELGGRGPLDDVAAVVAEEAERADAFAEGVARRVGGDIVTALALPDPKMREAAVAAMMEREQRYARMRSEAMAARAIAAIARTALRRDSPLGAFWKLSPLVAEHTAGCLIMGGKFWPWAVLDRVHPPRHAGCPCELISYGEAIAGGYMKPGEVPNVTDAVRLAQGVVMEAAAAQSILDEIDLRDRLAESGLASAEALAAIPLAVS